MNKNYVQPKIQSIYLFATTETVDGVACDVFVELVEKKSCNFIFDGILNDVKIVVENAVERHVCKLFSYVCIWKVF